MFVFFAKLLSFFADTFMNSTLQLPFPEMPDQQALLVFVTNLNLFGNSCTTSFLSEALSTWFSPLGKSGWLVSDYFLYCTFVYTVVSKVEHYGRMCSTSFLREIT
jgi:hypothetical protein